MLREVLLWHDDKYWRGEIPARLLQYHHQIRQRRQQQHRHQRHRQQHTTEKQASHQPNPSSLECWPVQSPYCALIH